MTLSFRDFYASESTRELIDRYLSFLYLGTDTIPVREGEREGPAPLGILEVGQIGSPFDLHLLWGDGGTIKRSPSVPTGNHYLVLASPSFFTKVREELSVPFDHLSLSFGFAPDGSPRIGETDTGLEANIIITDEEADPILKAMSTARSGVLGRKV